MRNGQIYCVETADSRFVKIGFTTNLALRVLQVRSDAKRMYRSEARLLGSIPGDIALERSIHQHLRSVRDIFEWYHNTAECKRLLCLLLSGCSISELPKPHAELADMAYRDFVAHSRTPSEWPRREDDEVLFTKNQLRAQLGGKARAKAMRPKARSESARKAAEARWGKPKDER